MESGERVAARGPRRSGARRPALGRLTRWVRMMLPDRLMFNPVFWKDSAITARKKGTFALRGLYMLLIVAVVGFAAIPLTDTLVFAGPAERMQAGTLFATTLAQVIQWTQFFALMISGPIIASGAIAQEKTNRSIDSLYATPLTRTQIMWGKLASRLVQILVLALMPVPILLMLRAFGGIDAVMTLQQTALILSAAAMTTSMGLLASVYSKRPWSVLGSTMLILLLLHLVLPVFLVRAVAGSMPTPDWVLIVAACIAPVYPFFTISSGGFGSWIGLSALVGPWLVFTAAVGVQLFIMSLITSSSSLLLRRVERPRGSQRRDAGGAAEAEVEAGTAVPPAAGGGFGASAARPISAAKPARRRRRVRGSRVVGDWPVFWRELRQPTIDLGRFQWLRWILFPAIGFAIAILFFVQMPSGERPYQEPYSYIALFALLGFYLMMVSLSRTAALVPHERSARTWDVLRTTPVGPLSIVLQKYFGSMMRPIVFGAALLLCMVPAVLLGVFHWAIVPLLALAMLQAMGLLAATGLLLGTMLRKGLAAMGANLGVAFGLWLLVPIGVAILADGFGRPNGGSEILWMNPFAQAGISMAGCYELSPNVLEERAVYGYGHRSEFPWPDEARTIGDHTFVLAWSSFAYLVVIGGCLGLASWRVGRMRPNA